MIPSKNRFAIEENYNLRRTTLRKSCPKLHPLIAQERGICPHTEASTAKGGGCCGQFLFPSPVVRTLVPHIKETLCHNLTSLRFEKIQERTNTTYIHESWTPQPLGFSPHALDKELTSFEITLLKKKIIY